MTATAASAGRVTAGAADRTGAVVVGLDLGTSGMKGVAVGAGGEILASAAAGYPTSRPAAGAAEQDPADWIRAAEQVTRALAARVPPARWRGIGLTAMIPAMVLADAAGRPVGPAVTWEDSRAEPHAERLHHAFRAAAASGARDGGEDGRDLLYRRTGQWVDGRYLLPMFLRLAEAKPAFAARAATLLSAKDFLFGWLTGEAATDPSTATGFGCFRLPAGSADVSRPSATGGSPDPGQPRSRNGPRNSSRPPDPGGPWDGDVLAAAAAVLGLRRLPALPPVLASAATRPLRAAAAARLGCGQVPVCLGAADSVLGALGLGARVPGQIAYVAGTSTVILGITDRPLLDPWHRFLVTPLAEAGSWGLEMDLVATGSAFRWLAGLFGGGFDERGIVALGARTNPEHAPVVLPYLGPGEQGALWDPALRGTIGGLTLGHAREHLARGLLTGILLESRRCLDVLDETTAFGPELLVAGGSAAEPAFRAELADVTGRRVIRPGSGDVSCSALGAALFAARQAGLALPAAAVAGRAAGGATPADATPADISEPDPARAELWQRLWARHERTRLALGRQHG